MNTTPAPEARPPGDRLALVSLVAALYAPIVGPLALWLYQLALAGHTIPLSSLAAGLLVLIFPAVVVALVSGHIALSRMQDHSASKGWRNVALGGLILGYSTVAVLLLGKLNFLFSGFGE